MMSGVPMSRRSAGSEFARAVASERSSWVKVASAFADPFGGYTDSNARGSRPIACTLAPAARRRRTHSAPMPREAPVTSAVRPASVERSALAAVVLDIVVHRLPQHEMRQLRGLERGLEHAPKGHDDGLRGG